MATSPATQVRTRLKTVIDACFAAETVSTENDKLDQALAQDRRRVACYPLHSRQSERNALVLETDVMVQFFDRFDPQINEEQTVDPAIIEGMAERLAEAVRTQKQINDSYCWYFHVLEIDYPDDPTGNKTRFTMRIRAFGSNPTAV